MMFISAPSFIIPATRLENVNYLKGKVDEVELLYMCSLSEYDMPDLDEIKALADIDIRYNVHMPYDRDFSKQSEWDFIAKFAENFHLLNAHTHTFHIQPDDAFFKGVQWFKSVTGLPVTLENGDVDIASFGLSDDDICLDVGHMVMHGQDVCNMLANYSDRIKLFHLHGVKDGKDHTSTRHLDENLRQAVLDFATKHEISVSLEVFNQIDLEDSLLFLNNRSR